jgi:hypothetical protein
LELVNRIEKFITPIILPFSLLKNLPFFISNFDVFIDIARWKVIDVNDSCFILTVVPHGTIAR